MRLLHSLAGSDSAYRIKLADSHDNLAIRLPKFLSAWREQETLPTTLRPYCSLLLEKIASKASDLDIWTAVAQILVAFDSSSSAVVKYLKNDWKSTFIGDSLSTLQDVIQNFECQPRVKRDKFYSRALVFLQSSGMGKSRLADAFGQGCPMINFVLREKGTFGFPPPDDEILSFMRERQPIDQEGLFPKSPIITHYRGIAWYHSLAVGLLQASFEIFNTWVEEPSRAGMRLDDLAALRHKEMTYNSESEETAHNSKSKETAHNSESNGLLNRRSKERIEFCKSVATRARKIADDLIQKPTWRRVFNLEEAFAIRHELTDIRKHHLDDLLGAARKLTDNLRKFPSENKYGPPLVVVLDEASSLLKEPGEPEKIRSERYIALNRIISCLKDYRIWFFIISTESHVGTIMPPDNTKRTDYVEDHSLRFAIPEPQQLKPIPPFLAFPLDMEDTRRMQDSTQEELGKSLSNFGKPKHMAMFGRPLWHAYVDDPEEMNKLAKVKLIGGVQMGSYQPHNEHHVFAALSYRLCLEACLDNSKALPLIRTGINSHMRVVISVNQDTGTMVALAPTEPILAKAAMEHLCSERNWSMSIDTLRELLEKRLVERGLKGVPYARQVESGLKGELYARLVVTLAHDWVRYRQGQQVSGEADGELQKTNSDGGIHQESEPDGGIHQESEPDFRPKFMKSFTVEEFLKSLYAEGHESIMEIDAKILEARINFTHFTATQQNLHTGILFRLFVALLRRGAALQLAPLQPTYDILIPIYLGKEDEVLEPSKCSCIVIQVKNRVGTTTPKAIFQEEFTMVTNQNHNGLQSSSTMARTHKAEESASTKAEDPIRGMENPILFLLFDLGGTRTEKSIAPSVEVSYSSNESVPRVWAIHSRGHDENVFGCLSLMGCVDAGKMFFISAVPAFSAHDQAARENDTFCRLARSFRLRTVKGAEESETENEDKDTGGYEMAEGSPKRDSREIAEGNEDNHPIVPAKKRRRARTKKRRRASAKRLT
jgi:hypothetical protein